MPNPPKNRLSILFYKNCNPKPSQLALIASPLATTVVLPLTVWCTLQMELHTCAFTAAVTLIEITELCYYFDLAEAG